MRWEDVDWINLAQGKDESGGCYEHLNEPFGCMQFGISST